MKLIISNSSDITYTCLCKNSFESVILYGNHPNSLRLQPSKLHQIALNYTKSRSGYIDGEYG